MNKLFWLFLSLIIVLVIIALIIFTKLTILLNYYHHNDNDDLKIEFRIWFGLIKYKIKVPLIKIDDNSPSVVVKSQSNLGENGADNADQVVKQITKNNVLASLYNSKEILDKVIHMHVIVRKFFKKVSVKKLEWHSLIGVGDAAHTGMLSGALWAMKGSLVGFLSHYVRLKVMPTLSVTPHFQAAVIETKLTCMFQFRIGHAILAGLKLIKFWKGGKPHLKSKADFQNEQSKSV